MSIPSINSYNLKESVIENSSEEDKISNVKNELFANKTYNEQTDSKYVNNTDLFANKVENFSQNKKDQGIQTLLSFKDLRDNDQLKKRVGYILLALKVLFVGSLLPLCYFEVKIARFCFRKIQTFVLKTP